MPNDEAAVVRSLWAADTPKDSGSRFIISASWFNLWCDFVEWSPFTPLAGASSSSSSSSSSAASSSLPPLPSTPSRGSEEINLRSSLGASPSRGQSFRPGPIDNNDLVANVVNTPPETDATPADPLSDVPALAPTSLLQSKEHPDVFYPEPTALPKGTSVTDAIKTYLSAHTKPVKADAAAKKPATTTTTAAANEGEQTLRMGMKEGYDYVVVCPEVWHRLVEWYGVSGPTFERPLISVGISLPTLRVELHPTKLVFIGFNNTVRTLSFASSNAISELRYRVGRLFLMPPFGMCVYWYINGGIYEFKSEDNPKTIEEFSIESGALFVLKGKQELTFTAGSGSGSYGSGYSSVYVPPVTNTKGSPAAPGLCGLRNIGNTCFLNSTMQPLLACLALAHHVVVAKGLPSVLPRDAKRDSPVALAIAINEFFRDCWSSRYSVVVPRSFKSAVAIIAPQFSGYHQHDAHEFLLVLLNTLHESLLPPVKPASRPAITAKSSDNNNNKTADDNDEEPAAPQDPWRALPDSFFKTTFQGLGQSRLNCLSCSQTSSRLEPFFVLSLPVLSKDMVLLHVLTYDHRSSSAPLFYGVRVHKTAMFEAVHLEIARLMDIPPHFLFLARVVAGRVYPIAENKPVASLRSFDQVVAFSCDLDALLSSNQSVSDDGQQQEAAVAADAIKAEATEPEASNSAAVSDDAESMASGTEEAEEKKDEAAENKENITAGAADDQQGNAISSSLENSAAHRDPNEPVIVQVQHQLGVNGRPFVLFFGHEALTPAIVRATILDHLQKFVSVEITDADFEVILHTDQKAVGEISTPDAAKSLATLNPNKSFLLLNWGNPVAVAKVVRQATTQERHPSCAETADDKDECTLEDCLASYLSKETVHNECKCKGVSAEKQMCLLRAPPVLVVQLCRFQSNYGNQEKLDTHVVCPTSLSLASLAQAHPDDAHDLDYELVGVVNHSGGLSGGHYTSHIRHPEGNWYHCNDQSVSRCASDRAPIDERAAYLLFYQSKGHAACSAKLADELRDFAPSIQTELEAIEEKEREANEAAKKAHEEKNGGGSSSNNSSSGRGSSVRDEAGKSSNKQNKQNKDSRKGSPNATHSIGYGSPYPSFSMGPDGHQFQQVNSGEYLEYEGHQRDFARTSSMLSDDDGMSPAQGEGMTCMICEFPLATFAEAEVHIMNVHPVEAARLILALQGQ